MILSGLYLAWYWYNDIRDNLDDTLTGHVLSWQERIANWIDSHRALLAVVFVVVVISAITFAVVGRRRPSDVS